MRWWVCTPSAAPGIDGGRTGEPAARGTRRRVLHTAHPQRRGARSASTRCARHRRHLHTLRTGHRRHHRSSNIQLHWIRVEDMPEIWHACSRRWASTTEGPAATPTRRARLPGGGHRIRRDPGRHPSHRGRSSAATWAIRYSNLPASSRVLSGITLPDVAHEINLRFLRGRGSTPSAARDRRLGGGGLSTNPMVAQRPAPGSRCWTRCPMSGKRSSRSTGTGYRRLQPCPPEVPHGRFGGRRSSGRCSSRSTSGAP